ncbi:MAG: hypothetical protein MJ252_18695 [archaeon]|nr:hypothetical protein [archaeon]
MNSVLILNKETFEILQEKQIVQNTFQSKASTDPSNASLIELVKDLDQLNTLTKCADESVTLKLDNGKTIIFRKSENTNLAVLIICEKKSYKRQSLILLSKILLNHIRQDELTKSISIKGEEFAMQAIEELTIKFIDYLRLNKLFAKFIYFNYNPNVSNSIAYKKTKLESTSVILFNSGKDIERIQEQKDTMLLKSTIKEKELNIDLDKKPNHPTDKKIFIKKFNNLKTDQLKKKSLGKAFEGNFFIEKYFLTKSTMMHVLFNNVFVESNQSNTNKDAYNYPINNDNDHSLLFMLDLYDKAQQMFAVTNAGNTEYLDLVNYIELNLSNPEVLLTKNKLIIVKYRALFIFIQLEIYEDKNYWSTINSNTNFYKEVTALFELAHGEKYKGGAPEADA